MATQYAPALSSPMGTLVPRALLSRCNVAVLSHAELIRSHARPLQPPYALRPRRGLVTLTSDVKFHEFFALKYFMKHLVEMFPLFDQP